jgi:hypothetical protein
MRLYPLAVAASFVALYAVPARAGMISITPTSSAITLGDKVTLTVRLNSTDPAPPAPPGPDSLVLAGTQLTASGPSSVTVANFQLASDLPAGSFFLKEDPATGSAIVGFGANPFSSFNKELYSYDFTPTATGTYTFTLTGAGAEYRFDVDEITSAPPATIKVQPGSTAAVPEPASVTLLGVGAAGLLGYGWRRRERAAA